MNEKNKLEQLFKEAPPWVTSILPVLGAGTGGIMLWLVWLFLKDNRYYASPHWYIWLQLAMIALMGILCIAASAFLTFHKPGGWDILWAALFILPLILTVRLAVVIFRLVNRVWNLIIINFSHIADGTILSHLRINKINAAIIIMALVVWIFSILTKADKSENGSKEKNDEGKRY